MTLLLTCAIFWNRISTRSILLNTDSLFSWYWLKWWLHSSFRLYLGRIKFSDWIMFEVWDKSYQPSVTKNNWIINYACKSMKKFHPTTNKDKIKSHLWICANNLQLDMSVWYWLILTLTWLFKDMNFLKKTPFVTSTLC